MGHTGSRESRMHVGSIKRLFHACMCRDAPRKSQGAGQRQGAGRLHQGISGLDMHAAEHPHASAHACVPEAALHSGTRLRLHPGVSKETFVVLSAAEIPVSSLGDSTSRECIYGAVHSAGASIVQLLFSLSNCQGRLL